MPGLNTPPEGSQLTPLVLYTLTTPASFSNPKLLTLNEALCRRIFPDLDIQNSDEWAQILSGQKLLPGMKTYSTRYGGHQFGHWAGQLGDGRAISLGEVLTKGERFEIQLKGAGPSVYSRNGDGFAVLRSSLREYVASEAMHHLGVPTTRALGLVASGEQVLRDILYNGNLRYEPGAITARVAPSFLRFGHFQILTSHQEFDLLRQLADYTIETFYPELKGLPAGEEKYGAWYQAVCLKTSEMIIHWQRVGFVHGVMNTDNMSILGLSIDYGPFGWLENFQADWTPNTTDLPRRRYAFKNQPQIAFWNLQQLGLALMPLFSSSQWILQGLEAFQKHFEQEFAVMSFAKLGLSPMNMSWIESLEVLLETLELDFTLFYRQWPELLRFANTDLVRLKSGLEACSYKSALSSQDLENFIEWTKALQHDTDFRTPDQLLAAATNPLVVPRNFQLQEAIQQLEKSDLKEQDLLLALLGAIESPYQTSDLTQPFAQKRPEWAMDLPGCSQLSCSS